MFMGHFLRFMLSRCWEQKLQVSKSSGTTNWTTRPSASHDPPVRAGNGDGAAARGLLSFATAGRRGLTTTALVVILNIGATELYHRSKLKTLPSELRSFIIKATVLTSNLLSFVATRYRLTSCCQLRSYWARVGGWGG